MCDSAYVGGEAGVAEDGGGWVVDAVGDRADGSVKGGFSFVKAWAY